MNAIMTNIGAFLRRVAAWAVSHKVWAGVIAAGLIGVGYWGYAAYAGSVTATQYVLAAAARGTITVTVSGSGQAAANQSLDLAPKASGTVTYVGVTAGQKVAAGQVIARIDDTDAEKSLRDASASLTSAQIAYQQAISGYETDSTKARDTALSATATTLSHLASILPDLDSALHDLSQIPGHTFQQNQAAYAAVLGDTAAADAAGASYENADAAYRSALAASNALPANPTPADTENLIRNAYAAASAAADAAARLHVVMNQVNDRLLRSGASVPASFATLISTVGTDASTESADAASALAAKSTLSDTIATIGSSAGTPLDVQSAELALTKAQNAYSDARDALADYVVVAPFSGTIAKVDVQTNDTASGSTAIATLVTDGQYAELSLNEVDAAKVQAGQKAVLTFDAVDGLTISGTVAEADQVGTVSQGVVTYNVKISFDEQDARVKPDMTVNAVITTASKSGAIIVPSSAVTTSGGRSFVQIAQTNATSTPRARTETVDASSVTIERVPVEVGLTNDTQTEIVSGIPDGATVVIRTITGAGATGTTTGTNGTRTTGTGAARTGVPSGGGGAVFLRGG